MNLSPKSKPPARAAELYSANSVDTLQRRLAIAVNVLRADPMRLDRYLKQVQQLELDTIREVA